MTLDDRIVYMVFDFVVCSCYQNMCFFTDLPIDKNIYKCNMTFYNHA